MPDTYVGPVERAYRMSVREKTLLYRRAYPQKDWLRRSVMRHRLRPPPLRRQVSVVREPSHREARLPRAYRPLSEARLRRAYPDFSEACLRRA